MFIDGVKLDSLFIDGVKPGKSVYITYFGTVDLFLMYYVSIKVSEMKSDFYVKSSLGL